MIEYIVWHLPSVSWTFMETTNSRRLNKSVVIRESLRKALHSAVQAGVPRLVTTLARKRRACPAISQRIRNT